MTDEQRAAQRAIGSPRGTNPLYKGAQNVGISTDQHDGLTRCWRLDKTGPDLVECPPGCVIIRSRRYGNFLSTGMGWEWFGNKMPHYTPLAVAVQLRF